MQMTMYKRYISELDELTARGMNRTIRAAEHDGAYILHDGRRMLNLSGNDYLGIATRDDLAPLGAELVARWGLSGSTSSRLLTGNSAAYDQLEQAIATSYGREAALVFSSGYHMNLGIVPALVDAQTVVLADRLVHASMIDGIRLAGARWERFRHNDLEHLERLIIKHRTDGSPHIIVMVESVYSMDGDCADLRRLVALKRQYPGVLLYVDEAHAVGVLGARGLGLAEATGTIGDIDLLCGTFGKALASMGGYVVCDEVLRRYLINRCRTLIFSTALPPLTVALTLALWQRLPNYGAERTRLLERADRLRSLLAAHGIDTPSQSHIIPIVVGTAERAVALADALQARGFYVLPIRPPTVPAGSCRLRISLTAETEIDELVQALRETGLLTPVVPTNDLSETPPSVPFSECSTM